MKIRNNADLKQTILYLNNKRKLEESEIKEHFSEVKESLRPANIIKSVFKEVASAPSVQQKVLGISLGLTVGMLSKRMILGKTKTMVGNFIGNAIEMRVAHLIDKNAPKIQAVSTAIYETLFNRKHKNHTYPSHYNDSSY